MTAIVVDCGMGNLGSIVSMARHIGREVRISADPAVVARAERLILPGVGAFDRGMTALVRDGMSQALNDNVIGRGAPILGICLGLQLMGRGSEEGSVPGLGWLDAEAVRFRFEEHQPRLKIPHMGWNTIDVQRPDQLCDGLPSPARFYFVHSYHMVSRDAGQVLATTVHGYPFPSVMRRDNVWGVQFHPEKSHRFGMCILANFLKP